MLVRRVVYCLAQCGPDRHTETSADTQETKTDHFLAVIAIVLIIADIYYQTAEIFRKGSEIMNRLDLSPDQPIFRQKGDILQPSGLTTGPWYPGTQHGSAMMLMAALAADRFPSEIPRQVTRLTVDMMRAAPLTPLQLTTTVRKGGRNTESLDISIHADGEEYVRASALRFRVDEVPVLPRMKFDGQTPVLPPPLPFNLFSHAAQREGFHHAIELRVDVETQPAVMWFRLKHPVLPELFATPLLRVALAADWTYSIPNIAHRVINGEWAINQAFYGINPDTTINLHRPPEGEWIAIQTHATYDDLGAGTVMGQIFDLQGPVGFSTQSILLRSKETSQANEKKTPKGA